MKFAIITAWHNEKQKDEFLEAWNVKGEPDWLILQQDKFREGCARTKNRGIEKALERDAEYIVILDDDCYPRNTIGLQSLKEFAEQHIKALEPQQFEMFEAITDPPSRGTPYFDRSVMLPVAASMGFWNENQDYDALSQLVYRNKEMMWLKRIMFWRFFALSGMNLCLPRMWAQDFRFVDVPRFDDIWAGLALQVKAYKAGYCFNLCGPTVRHVRQSNVWNNLKVEAENLERNETEWKRIAGYA